jgi:hypothetical protein
LRASRYDFPPSKVDAPHHPRTNGIPLGLSAEAGFMTYELHYTHQRAQVFKDTLRNDTVAIGMYARHGAQISRCAGIFVY